jgi:hypothetical protein
MSAPVRSLLLSSAACLLVLATSAAFSPARAEDASPARAAQLENQVREAIGGLLGPAVNLAASPVKITAAGDHYDVSLPIPGPRGPAGPQTIQLTGMARPGDNGTWVVENVRTTNPLTFTIDMPQPGASPGTQPVPTAPIPTTPVTYTLDQQGQTGRILWDPSFKTPSTWTASTQATTFRAAGAPGAQASTIGPISTVATLRPAGPDRLDALLDGTMQDYRMDMTGAAAGGNAVQAGMKTVRVTAALNGVSREHGAALIRALASMGASVATAPPPPGTPPKVAPELLKATLAALQDFASDFTLDETLEGFIVSAQGQTVALDRMKIGMDARSDTGLLRAGLTLGMEGLTLPDMPLGDMAALIPTRIALRPVVGGVAVADLLHLATLASENSQPGPADIAALFSHGGITGGIESMAVDVAGASFTGQGTMVATSPDPAALSGTATITAEHFDALMQKVQSMPALAQQAVPVMVFIKGIGRDVGGKLVWDISYKEGRVLINNVDLTAMAGGRPSAAARPPAAPPAAPPSLAPRPPAGPSAAAPRPSGTVRPIPSWAR